MVTIPIEHHQVGKKDRMSNKYCKHCLSRVVAGVALIGIYLFCSPLSAEAQAETTRHKAVLAMHPAGYWPADEGEGTVLHDRSSNVNHGSIKRVPWDVETRLLDFTGAYQWLEIPNRPYYQTKDFSIGAWVFLRGKVTAKQGMTFIGNAYGDSGYTLEMLYDEPVLFRKSKLYVAGVPFDHRKNGLSICIRGDELVDIISGGKDAIGSLGKKIRITTGQWQHILYTYRAERHPMEGGDAWKGLQDSPEYRGDTGVGTLFINGEPVKSKEGVPFTPRDAAFLIGSDAYCWWQPKGGSLEGSLRNIVMFDRALTPTEVLSLGEATRPSAQPKVVADELKAPQPAGVESLPELLGTLRDKTKSQVDRAQAALAIGSLKDAAKDAVPVLISVLEENVKPGEARTPRIEELLRNAATRALLDIAPNRPEVGTVLKLALPKAAREGERFFTQGDPNWDGRPNHGNKRAYTSVTAHDAVTYTLGSGEAFNAVEAVKPEAVVKAIEALAPDYPEARTWRKPDAPNLYRVKIIKADAQGAETTTYLEGENFIFDGVDAKVRGWSVATDKDGYIHITGGMHNAPNEQSFIPGSWERMGASRDFTHDDYPAILYWVSREPGDIASMAFVGQRANLRRPPVPHGINYMNFARDNHGELYLYGRIHVQGIQCWGLYHYDTGAHRWNAVGGFAPDVKKEFPEWAAEHIRFGCDWLALPTMRWRHDHPHNRTLAWARQPHFYNYIRSWGVKFDPTNRMHVMLELFGFDETGHNANRTLYAWSDDSGNTFHRADGTAVALPLTVNPGPGNADMGNHSTRQWWDLWLGLLKQAGYNTSISAPAEHQVEGKRKETGK